LIDTLGLKMPDESIVEAKLTELIPLPPEWDKPMD